MTTMYFIIIWILFLYSGYRFWKEFHCQSNWRGWVLGSILWVWVGFLLFHQLPHVYISNNKLKDQYQGTHYILRDRNQEDPELYRVSRGIRLNVPGLSGDTILLLFSREKSNSLDWISASYWQYRLRYRNYPIKMDFFYIGRDGQYHDYFELLLKNRPGFESQSQQGKIVEKDFTKAYPIIFYIGSETALIPKGFILVQKENNFLIFKRRESQ